MMTADTLQLGRRQRRMLYEMATFGDGGWPRGWRIYQAHQRTLDNLYRRGLVTSADKYAELTGPARAYLGIDKEETR